MNKLLLALVGLLVVLLAASVAAYGQDTCTTKTFGDADNTYEGTSGCDIVYAGGGRDTIDGNGGPDQLFGQAGADDLTGGNGNDALRGGDGNDDIFAAGDDFLGTTQGDVINCGPGDDTVRKDAVDEANDNCELVITPR